MVTYLGGSILITIFALGGSIVSYNLHLLMIITIGRDYSNNIDDTNFVICQSFI